MNSDKLSEAPAAVREFLMYMQTIRGRSMKTVDEYYMDLRTFFRWLLKRRGLADPGASMEDISIRTVDLALISSVTLTDLYEFLYYISNERENNASTRSRKISCLRSFYKYLCNKAGLIKENPTRNLETPKKKKSLPKHLTLEESMEFLKTIGGDHRERDFCIVTLFLNCGMRLSELCGLNLGDISEETIKVTGKGNKERILYLNDACKSALQSYLRVRQREGVRDRDALFLSRLGKRISPKTVQWLIKKNLGEAGLANKGYSTHKLRHTAATLMYQYGKVDIRVLQEILGHENLSTTEIYTHLSGSQMKEAVDKSPLSRFGVARQGGKKKKANE